MASKDIHSIDLNHLRTLIALYQENSVQVTAERMGITPPAVSYSLRRLREALDDALFVRTGNGLSPTARTHTIMKELPGLVADLDNLLHRSVSFDPSELKITINIAMPDVIGSWLTPKLYHRLTREAPGVMLNSTFWVNNTMKRLESEEVNLGIHVFKVYPKSIMMQDLQLIDPVILCNQNHPLIRESTPPTMETLSRFPFILNDLPSYNSNSTELENLFSSHDLKLQCGAKVSHLNAAITLIKETDMLMLTARQYLPEQIDQLATPPVPIEMTNLHPTLKVYHHLRQKQNPFYKWLVDIICEEVANHEVNLLTFSKIDDNY